MKRNDRRLARRKTPATGNEPVAPIDDTDDESVRAAPVVDWRIVRGRGRPVAHAITAGARRVLCGTALVDSSTPAPPAFERCPVCLNLATKEPRHAPSES